MFMNYFIPWSSISCDDIRSLHHSLVLTNDVRNFNWWWFAFSGTMIDENYAMYRFTAWIRFRWCKWFTDEQMNERITSVHKHPQSLIRTIQKQQCNMQHLNCNLRKHLMNFFGDFQTTFITDPRNMHCILCWCAKKMSTLDQLES